MDSRPRRGREPPTIQVCRGRHTWAPSASASVAGPASSGPAYVRRSHQARSSSPLVLDPLHDLRGPTRGEFGLAGKDCLIEVKFGLEQGRPIFRPTWRMPLVLEQSRDMGRTSRAQLLNKAFNGSSWYDGIIEAVREQDGPVDLIHEIGR